MEDESSSDQTPITRGEFKQKISEEIAKALEANIPQIITGIKTELLASLEERITELKDNTEAGRGKPNKNYPYDKFVACKPS